VIINESPFPEKDSVEGLKLSSHWLVFWKGAVLSAYVPNRG
jgi:hypothetical protein